MTVRELITALGECDPDYPVVMSKDGEGNDFSPLSEAAGENNVYVPETTWSGEVHLHHLTDELRARGFSGEEVYDEPDGARAVVLWPTN
jgi:hypothetical protein